MSFKTPVYHWLAVLALPLLYLALAVRLKMAAGPFYLGSNCDPSYLYLVNALYLADGISPGFVQHPGVPLHVLGAAVIRLFNGKALPFEIAEHVFRNPEFYLHAVYAVITALNVVTLILLGRYAAQQTKNIFLGILSQTSILFLLTWNFKDVAQGTIPVAANVNAENALVWVANVFNLLILKLYFRGPVADRNAYGLGALMGLTGATGVMTKVIFLVWMLVPFILLRRWKERAVFMSSFVLTAALWILPVRQTFGGFLEWNFMVLSHTGGVGNGPAGFIGWNFFQNLLTVFASNWIFFTIVLGVSVLALVSFLRGQLLNHDRRFLAVFCLGAFLSLLMLAKQPQSHYVVPTFMFFGPVCFFAVRSWAIKEKLVKGVLAVGIVAASGLTLWVGESLAAYNRDILNFSQKVFHDYKDATVFSYYRSSSPAFALQFADQNQGYLLFRDVLKTVYPDSYYFYYWDRYFHDGTQTFDYDSLTSRFPRMMLYGSRLPKNFNDGFVKVSEVASARSEALYRVDRITVREAKQALAAAKLLESQKRYSDACVFAREAKALGAPDMDAYIETLLKAIITEQQ